MQQSVQASTPFLVSAKGCQVLKIIHRSFKFNSCQLLRPWLATKMCNGSLWTMPDKKCTSKRWQDRLGRCEAGPGQRKKPSLMGFGGLMGWKVWEDERCFLSFQILMRPKSAEVFEILVWRNPSLEWISWVDPLLRTCLCCWCSVYRSLAMCAVETFVCRIAESSDSTARDLLYSRLELWHRWLAHQPWFIEGTWQTEEPQLTKRSFPISWSENWWSCHILTHSYKRIRIT